jgi:hypothetical protein
MVNADLHVVFGAGQVGYPLAQRLLAGGKRVRIVKRSAAGIPAGWFSSRRVERPTSTGPEEHGLGWATSSGREC